MLNGVLIVYTAPMFIAQFTPPPPPSTDANLNDECFRISAFVPSYDATWGNEWPSWLTAGFVRGGNGLPCWNSQILFHICMWSTSATGKPGSRGRSCTFCLNKQSLPFTTTTERRGEMSPSCDPQEETCLML